MQLGTEGDCCAQGQWWLPVATAAMITIRWLQQEPCPPIHLSAQDSCPSHPALALPVAPKNLSAVGLKDEVLAEGLHM